MNSRQTTFFVKWQLKHRVLEAEFAFHQFQRTLSFVFVSRLDLRLIVSLSIVLTAVDLHTSKPLISLVPFNLHFHCFQG